MSLFSDFHSSGMDYLLTASGESVVYVDVAGKETPLTAIVGNERVREIKTEQGLQKLREIEVSLPSQIVPDPLLNARVRVRGEEWPIESIAGKSVVNTRVVLQLPLRRGRNR